MEQDSPAPAIRDVPWILWGCGFVCLATVALSTLAPGAFFGFELPGIVEGIVGAIGLLLLALPSALTIRVDAINGFLTLTYRSLLRRSMKEIPLDRIASIDAEATNSSEGGTLYRVVITEHDGTTTPLRSHYGRWNRKLAHRLRELIGVGGSNRDPATFKQAIDMLTGQDKTVNRQIRDEQEALTGPNEEMRETDGVRWNLQSTAMGTMPVTRWFSPDYKTNGTFVCIAQHPAYGNTVGGRIGKLFTSGIIGQWAMRIAMPLYGFVGDDVPGSAHARMLAIPRLDLHFMACSPDPNTAQQILNPIVTAALNGWAARHPLKTIQTVKSHRQFVVLFSPHGVYAATLGKLDPTLLDDVASTGVLLVKSQRLQAPPEPDSFYQQFGPSSVPPIVVAPPEPATAKSGCGWKGCALGCLGTAFVMFVMALAGTWWVVKKLPDFARAAVVRGIHESDLLDADKEMLISQIDRLVDGYKRGRFDGAKLEPLEKTLDALMDLLFLRAAQAKYLNGAELTPDERTAAERLVQRVTRGVIEKRIPPPKLKDALNLISSTAGNGGRVFRDPITADEIRSFLETCTRLVDEASIPDEDYKVDIGAEIKKRVDEALGETAEAPAPNAQGVRADRPRSQLGRTPWVQNDRLGRLFT